MRTFDFRTLGVTNGTGLHRFNRRVGCPCETMGENVVEIRTVVFSLGSCVFYPMNCAPRACGVRARMYIGSSLDVFEQLIFNRYGNSNSIAKHNAIDNRLSNGRTGET